MAAMDSRDFNLLVRDVDASFQTLIQNMPVLMKLVGTDKPGKHTKHEWLDFRQTPTSTTLGGDILSTDYNAISVASAVGFQAGDIVAFIDTGVLDLAVVASVDTASTPNTITFTNSGGNRIGYGSTTPAAHLTGVTVKLQSRPRAEGSSADPTDFNEATAIYNYMQIFSRSYDITETAKNVDSYMYNDIEAEAFKQKQQELMWEMNRAMIFGARVDAGTGARTMGGLFWWATQSSALTTDASGADLTAAMINDEIENAVNKGAMGFNTIVAGTVQARKFSSLMTRGTNEYVTHTQSEQRYGQRITEFLGDLPMGTISKIMVDTDMPDDKVLLLDTSRIKLVPLQNRTWKDKPATTPGDDKVSRRIIGEYTMKIKNYDSAMALIHNLKTT